MKPMYAATPAAAPTFFQLARRSFWLLFGGIFLVAGLLLASISAGMIWQEGRFAGDGHRVEGVVLGRTIREADAAEDRSTEYHVRYRFTTSAGQVVEGTDGVSFERWEMLIEEGPITVEYLLGDAGQNRAAGGDDAVVLYSMAGIGLVVFGVGLAICTWQLRRLRQTHRLWREGVAIEGTVVRVEPANVTFNNRPLFRLRYEYGDQTGARHDGTSGLLAWEDVEGWQPGDRGSIRYDPRRPEQSAWIGEPSVAQARS
ncbi:MAG: DUF3592 domain-containing protein [Candidatus Limnocylindria bacterium]